MPQRYVKFTGTHTEYRMLHYWVEKQLGKPMVCTKCETTTAKRYNWANISGEYKRDITDWIRLCPKCHYRMDGRPPGTYHTGPANPMWNGDSCQKGHAYTPENLFMKVTKTRPRPARVCMECQRANLRAYRAKIKAASPTEGGEGELRI